MLHKLQWRYATKKFDPEKKIDEDTVTELLKAMNLTASSYGLQPYSFIVVHNDQLQDRLKEAAYGQSQVADASHVIVIAAQKNISENQIDDYIENIAKTRNQSIESLSGFGDSIKDVVLSMDQSQQLSWAQRQCYIPLGTLLIAAADKKVDACPMEGFDVEKFNDILGLNEHDLHATVMITLGHRSVKDEYQHEEKVRKKLTDIVELRYE